MAFSKLVIEYLCNSIHAIEESIRALKLRKMPTLMTLGLLYNVWVPIYLDHTHMKPFAIFSLENTSNRVGHIMQILINFTNCLAYGNIHGSY